jgi:hypothetical protein
MLFPVFMLCNNWNRQPFLLRLGELRVLVDFSDRQSAIDLAAAYQLQPPAGIAQIDGPAELLLWMKAAHDIGATEVWIDPKVGDGTILPKETRPLDDVLEDVSKALAGQSEMN